MKRTPVREVLTTAVVTAGEDMPFRHPVALLFAKGIGAVPVVAPAGQVLGVVSNADLTAKAAGRTAATAGPPLEFPRAGGGPGAGHTAGYSAPNFLISSNSASVS